MTKSYNYNWNWEYNTGYDFFPEKLPSPTTLYYFAFGSNMSRKRMQERGVIWESIQKATLKGFRLTFNKTSDRKGFGFATIQKSKGDYVEGLLYKCESEEDAFTLDMYESAPTQYKRVEKQVRTSKGRMVNAFMYIATKSYSQKGLKPTVKYLDYLLEGEKYLTREYLKKLKSFTPPKQHLRVFVYGTLKKGFGNHHYYCKDALKIEKARVRGHLYVQGALPYASVSDYACIGTRNNDSDFKMQEDFQNEPNKGIFRGSECIHGELVTFDSWEDVSRLDSLEGFYTTTQPTHNHYTRVLTSCKTQTDEELSCWVYIIGDKNSLDSVDLVKSGSYDGTYTRQPLSFSKPSRNDYLDSSFYYAQLEAESHNEITFNDGERNTKEDGQEDLFDIFNNPKF